MAIIVADLAARLALQSEDFVAGARKAEVAATTLESKIQAMQKWAGSGSEAMVKLGGAGGNLAATLQDNERKLGAVAGRLTALASIGGAASEGLQTVALASQALASSWAALGPAAIVIATAIAAFSLGTLIRDFKELGMTSEEYFRRLQEYQQEEAGRLVARKAIVTGRLQDEMAIRENIAATNAAQLQAARDEMGAIRITGQARLANLATQERLAENTIREQARYLGGSINIEERLAKSRERFATERRRIEAETNGQIQRIEEDRFLKSQALEQTRLDMLKDVAQAELDIIAATSDARIRAIDAALQAEKSRKVGGQFSSIEANAATSPELLHTLDLVNRKFDEIRSKADTAYQKRIADINAEERGQIASYARQLRAHEITMAEFDSNRDAIESRAATRRVAAEVDLQNGLRGAELDRLAAIDQERATYIDREIQRQQTLRQSINERTQAEMDATIAIATQQERGAEVVARQTNKALAQVNAETSDRLDAIHKMVRDQVVTESQGQTMISNALATGAAKRLAILTAEKDQRKRLTQEMAGAEDFFGIKGGLGKAQSAIDAFLKNRGALVSGFAEMVRAGRPLDDLFGEIQRSEEKVREMYDKLLDEFKNNPLAKRMIEDQLGGVRFGDMAQTIIAQAKQLRQITGDRKMNVEVDLGPFVQEITKGTAAVTGFDASIGNVGGSVGSMTSKLNNDVPAAVLAATGPIRNFTQDIEILFAWVVALNGQLDRLDSNMDEAG